MRPDVCYENITAPVRLMPQSTTGAHVPPGPQTHPALSQYNFSRSQVICKQIKDVQVLYHATCHVGIILFFRANGLEWNPWMNEWNSLDPSSRAKDSRFDGIKGGRDLCPALIWYASFFSKSEKSNHVQVFCMWFRGIFFSWAGLKRTNGRTFCSLWGCTCVLGEG